MGIDFEWDFDEQGSESPLPTRSGPSGGSSVVWLVISVLAVTGLVTAGIVSVRIRQRQVERELRTQLETLVAGETLALRMGNKEAFKNAQADITNWEAYQRNTFEAYTEEGILATGDIVDMQIEDDRAQVTLREEVNGDPHLATWFYRHYDSQGWLHVPPDMSWYDPLPIPSDYFDVLYLGPNPAEGEAITAALDAHMDAVCQLDICGEERIPVRIRFDLRQSQRWLSDDGIFLYPVEWPDRLPEGSTFTTEEEYPISKRVWLSLLLGSEAERIESGLLRLELNKWMEAAVEGQAIPPDEGLLAAMTTLSDEAVVPGLISAVRAGEDPNHTLGRMLIDAFNGPGATREERMLVMMQVLVEVPEGGYGNWDLFNEPGKEFEYEGPLRYLNDAIDISTMRIANVEEINGVLWATFQADIENDAPFFARSSAGEDPSEAVMTWQMPFREIEGQLYCATLTEADWGERRTATAGSITISYYAMDETYALNVLERIEAAVSRMMLDMQVDNSPPITIDITSPRDTSDIYSPSRVDDDGSISLTHRSPREELNIAVLDEDGKLRDIGSGRYFMWEAISLAGYSIYEGQGTAFPMPLFNMTLWHYLDGLDYVPFLPFAPGDPSDPEGSGIKTYEEADLATFWTPDEPEMAVDHSRFDGAWFLVEVLIAEYGEEAYPALLSTMLTVDTVEEWLAESVGAAPEDLKEAWLARIEQYLERQPIP